MGFERIYDYNDAPTLKAFSESDKFFRLVIGPLGSGKSSACVAEIISRGCAQKPNSNGKRKTRWAIVRNTFSMLQSTTQKTIYDWVPPIYFGVENQTRHTYIINKISLDDGTDVEIELMFRALDDADDVRNLLSLELTGAWFNELREIPKVIVDGMEGRVKRYPSVQDGGFSWSGIIADTNPPDQESWIYKLFEEQLPKNPELQSKYELFKQPSGRSDKAENLKYLDKDYYKQLAIGKDPEFIKVYIDGDYGYVRDGKPVYANYMDSVHCAEKDIEPVRGYPLIASYDFGLNPSCVVSQYLASGKFNVLAEFTEENIGLRTFLTEIIKPWFASHYKGFEVITTGDPAGMKRNDSDEKNCFIELRNHGFMATPAATNSLLARVNAVDSFLTKMIGGSAAFQLSPCCKKLRRGFIGEYKLKAIKGFNEIYSEVPVKNIYSHLQDALQYGAMLADRGNVSGARGFMGSRYDSPVINKPASKSMLAWT